MASTINASSSGSGGLISTGDASGVLQLQTNGSIALAIDTSKRVGIGASPANNNNPLQAYYSAAGNIASISITNTDTSSDYSHAGLYMEAKNGAVYGSIFTDKANALLRLGYNTTGATLGINGSGNIASFGGQITFPATQSASSDPNTLDDYEEGTWTPVVTAGTGSLTSYTSSGKYTKVGNLVTVMGYITLTNVGTASGTLDYSGLPFTSNYSTGFIQPATPVRESNSTGNIYYAIVNGGNTTGYIQNSTAGGIAWTNNYRYSFVVTYQT